MIIIHTLLHVICNFSRLCYGTIIAIRIYIQTYKCFQILSGSLFDILCLNRLPFDPHGLWNLLSYSLCLSTEHDSIRQNVLNKKRFIIYMSGNESEMTGKYSNSAAGTGFLPLESPKAFFKGALESHFAVQFSVINH